MKTDNQNLEAELYESKLYLSQIQQIAHLGTYTYDIIDNEWKSSTVLDSLFGIEPNHDKSFEGWVSIIHADWQEEMKNYVVNEVIGNKSKFDKEYLIVRKSDNQERWVHGMGELFYNEKQEPVKLMGTIQDITDRKIAEEKLRISEEKYREIFDNVQDVFFKTNLEGKILEVSPSVKFFLDFTREEFIGQNVEKLYYNIDDRKELLEILFTKMELRDYELYFKTRTGEKIIASLNARLISDSNGNPTHINGSIRDITKRKKTEEALQQSEKFLRDTQALASIGNWTIDFTTKSWSGSEILNQILVLSRNSERTITDVYNLVHPEWKTFLKEYFQTEVVAKGGKFNVKFKIIRQNDQAERWVHGIGELKLNELKQPVLMIGTAQDITKRKEAKEELRQSKEELKNFASHLQNVREEERVLLAREIHDELGQILIALKIDLGLLKQTVIKSIKKVDAEDILTNFDNVFRLVDNTIKTTRKIMTDLRPEVLYLVGFVEAAKIYLNEFKERHNIFCFFDYPTVKLELSSQQSVVLYRIIQESLANVARHSKATKVRVTLQIENCKLTLKISDNGIGFNSELQTKNESFGIIGMKERVYLLDGELQIDSKINEGTSIKVLIPYHYK